MPNIRPEHSGPPELFYGDDEASKYTFGTRNSEIQLEMCKRAVELLLLAEDKTCLLLDIGCGSALSGSVLDDFKHTWVGLDISPAMLAVALDRKVQGDLLLSDMGSGLPFKTGLFDGAISISALQWLCYADKTNHTVQSRLKAFFVSLFACLSPGARAVFQFYPENDKQIDLLTAAASKAGFNGGLVVDFPNSKKARKMYLVLMTGGMTTTTPSASKNKFQSSLTRFGQNRKKKPSANKAIWKKKHLNKKQKSNKRF